MEYIIWRNNFSVGNAEIDNQHKKIIELINMLYDAFMKSSDELDTDMVLQELAEYAKLHFKYEEGLFDELGFIQKKEHKSKHDSFIETINKLVSESNGNKKLLSMKITSFLQKWLVSHILDEDSKYKYLFAKS